MIYQSVADIVCDDVFLDISNELRGSNNTAYLKLEGMNPAGSIKMKTARYLFNDAMRQREDGIDYIIESSSGNLGIALAMICASNSVPFECVVDINTLPEKVEMISALGAKVTVISKPDGNGGYLGSRIKYIKDKIEKNPRAFWTNQYANAENVAAHYCETAPAICGEFDHVDYLFVGAGTTGTLLGCLKYFSEFSPKTKVVAVDAVGSVTFGDQPRKRYLPGIGTSERPPLQSTTNLFPHDVLHIDEVETIQKCRRFSGETGLLIGASTGSVVAAAERYIDQKNISDKTIVLVSADTGHPYLSSIYSDNWVQHRFPNLVMNKREMSPELRADDALISA